jgi:hypothetical protein
VVSVRDLHDPASAGVDQPAASRCGWDVLAWAYVLVKQGTVLVGIGTQQQAGA